MFRRTKCTMKTFKNFMEDAPTMSMGGGGIAGSVEAGDDPPVKKKKPTDVNASASSPRPNKEKGVTGSPGTKKTNTS